MKHHYWEAPIVIYLFLGGRGGGLLLRYLCVYSDERAEIPGENRYYNRTADPHAEFVEHWTYGENMY